MASPSPPRAASVVSSTQVAALVYNYLRSNGFYKVRRVKSVMEGKKHSCLPVPAFSNDVE
jgi:hypothetical protein